jgi:citrate lyase subunit beta/citryl-CoA lyase
LPRNKPAGARYIQYAGESHDRATYRYYWNVLQKARTTGVPVPADADRAFFG